MFANVLRISINTNFGNKIYASLGQKRGGNFPTELTSNHRVASRQPIDEQSINYKDTKRKPKVW